MNLAELREALLYSTVINLAFLALWGLLYLLPHGWIYGLVGRVFQLSAEKLDAISFGGILLYKIGVLIFNLVPYLALRLVG